MPEHSRFEELCALAAVGQISEAELAEFQGHLRDCDFCQKLQGEFVEIGAASLSQRPEPDVYDPRSALRHRVLRNLESAGAKFSEPVREEISKKTGRFASFRPLVSRAPEWATLAAVVIVGILGFGIGTYHHSSRSVQPYTISPVAPAPVIAVKAPGPASSTPDPVADQRSVELQQKLAASEAERARTQMELRTLAQEIATLQKARNQEAGEIARLTTLADGNGSAAQLAEAQLRRLQDAQTAKDADLVAAQYHVRELEGRLSDQAAAAERDRQLAQLAAGSEIRDVIGARNLHIIDVADVDNGGKRKAVGRVFYTEGKSLIFYAFDLANTKGKQTFYAWGHREGDPHTTRALGALFNDDQAQRRWVFKCNDAKVLAQIDSIYVTLEPNDRPGSKPKGKKLLNAYLGTPANHP